MGAIAGAVAGAVLFLIFGLMPAFRFGGFLALFILSKVTGKPVQPTGSSRALIAAGSALSILFGAVFFIIIGTVIGLLL